MLQHHTCIDHRLIWRLHVDHGGGVGEMRQLHALSPNTRGQNLVLDLTIAREGAATTKTSLSTGLPCTAHAGSSTMS